MLMGSEGRIFVNRGTRLRTSRSSNWRSEPLPREAFTVYAARQPGTTATGRANWTRSSTTWATSSTACTRGNIRSRMSKASTAASPPATWATSRCGWADPCSGIRNNSSLPTTRRRMACCDERLAQDTRSFNPSGLVRSLHGRGPTPRAAVMLPRRAAGPNGVSTSHVTRP